VENVGIMDQPTQNQCIGRVTKGRRAAGKIKWILGKGATEFG
jgi:hypothetical protein